MDEGVNSQFNAGVLQMQRLHQLQDRINTANMNLLAFNEDFQVYNFELYFYSLKSLMQEGLPKFSKKETEEVLNYVNTIEEALLKYPVFQEKKNLQNNKPYLHHNKKYWDTHKKMLLKFESLIRLYLDKHKLNSPPEDESALF